MAKLSLSYPETWLTISISLKDRDTWIEEFSGVMTEVSKVYKYDFVEVAWIDYIYVATCTGYDDMTGVIYAESTTSGGLTTEEHNKLFSLENSTGGGVFSSQAIQTSISNAKKAIMDRIDEIKPTDLSGIENTLNEISSQNDIAKWEIIDTIKETEIEVCSNIIRKTKDLEKSNVKTRNLVRQKTEKIDKNVSKLSDRQDKTDKMIEDEADELEDQIDALYEKEADDLEKEIDDKLNEEFDQIESETNQLTNGNN